MSSGSQPAVVTPQRAVSRPEFDALAQSVREGLAAAVAPGASIGLWVEDPLNFAACAAGALQARAQAFIVTPGATVDRALELNGIESGSAILCDASHARLLPGRPQRECGPGLILVDTAGRLADRDDSAQGALHFYTSGTDGTPKGVCRSQGSLALEESTVGAHLGMGPGCTVLCAVPPTHGYGYTAGLFAPMRFGGTSVLARPRMAASLAKQLSLHQPDIVVAVPSQYAAWAALRHAYTGSLPRLWLCGGAPLPQAVRARFSSAWGSVIAEQYGMTEVGAVTVDLDGTETLGKPYPGVKLTIEGADGPGDLGEVIVDAPYGPRGYVGAYGANPADADPAGADLSRFTSAGFRSGDTGWLDAEGRLHLIGRRAHQLNIHGQKVDPAEIERAYWAVDGMAEVAVVGMDREVGDQWIAVFVVCPAQVSDEALREATAHLDAYKRPQRVLRLSALPKNATGKTDFKALRAAARPAG